MRTCQLRGHVRRSVQCDESTSNSPRLIRELEFGVSAVAWRAERGHRRVKSLTVRPHVLASHFLGPGRSAKP